MGKMKVLICGLVLGLAGVTTVYAAPHTDRMAQCLVQKTTAEDRVNLMKWVFSAMAAHPSLKTVSNLSPQQMQSYDKNIADLVMRLFTVDCKNELQVAIREDGPSAIERGFGILGEVAMMEMMQNPQVAQRMQNFSKYLDDKKLSEVLQ